MRENRKVGINLLILVLTTVTTVTAIDPQVDSITPSCGSLNGGTRITIYGSNFARNFFNYGEGNEDLGSRVQLANINSFECEIHADGSHETQIMCYTLPMPAGDYEVRVSVDGIPVPSDRYCSNPNKCIFKTSMSCTPTITEVIPSSGMPGTFLTIHGSIKTDKYGTNEPDEFEDLILRVYYGGQKCELKDLDNDAMYGISITDGNGWMTCHTEGTYIGNIMISYLVSNAYGRSLPDKRILHLSRKGPRMYQSFTEISHISQSQGSVAGGTRLVITGQHFDETDSPAQVFVGGQECMIVEPITDTTIVCRTPAAASNAPSDYAGGRGWYSFVHHDIADEESFDYDTAIVSHVDSSSYTEKSNSSAAVRLTGLVVPPYTGAYTFHINKRSGSASVLLSNGSNPEHKTEISSGGSPQMLQADTPYYMEIHHASSDEEKYVTLRARLAQTHWSEEDTLKAEHEIQSIRFTSTITRDIQGIEVVATGNTSNVKPLTDVQTITISGNPSAYFALGLDGIYTVPFQLSGVSSAVDIEVELSKLPSIYFDVAVDLQVTVSGVTLVIHSSSSQGEISDYMARVVGGEESELTFSLERTILGKPDLETFTLTMDGVPTPPIPVGAPASQVQSAIETLFEVSCHPKLNEGTVFGYESGASWINGRVSDVEPFCGHYSVRNPRYIYHRGFGEEDIGLRVSSSQNTYMCFAYKGLGKVSSVRVYFTYIDEEDESRTSIAYIYVTNENPTKWIYHCENIFDLMRSRVSGRGYALWYIRAYRAEGGENLFIDHVSFIKRPPLEDAVKDGINYMRGPHVQPNDYFIDTVTVTAPSASQYQIELSPHHCGHDLPPFGVAGAFFDGSVHTVSNDEEVVVNVTRIQTASPPIGGSFSVTFKGETSPTPIPVTVELDTDNIVDNLATIKNVGFSEVTGTGSCSAFTYKVKMVSTTGDQPLMEIDPSLLTGTNVQVTVTTNQHGGVWFDPIMGDFLRTHHTSPQVEVFINDIPSKCSGPTNCTFDYSSDFTPTVSAISPSSGSHGDMVSIYGTGFDGSNPNNNEVIIGSMPCTVISVDSTTINCTINNGPNGPGDVKVYVDGKGLAETNVTFTYVTGVDSYSSISGSVEGGTLLTIGGFGFTSEAVVTVGGNECTIKNISESQITCKTPQAESESEAENVTVVITQHESTTDVGQFTYDPALTYTPVITAISSTASNIWGGDPLTIDGQGFGNVEMPVTLGGVQLTVSSYNDTQIVAIFPALSHGSYKLLVDVENKGYADLRTNSISNITYTFQVNSMTPTSGSMYGGTDLFIAGEGFSTDEAIYDVSVGDHTCDIESVTSTSIKCRIADTGRHHFISANGTHKFYGVGYAWDKDPYTVNVGDYVTWSWETPFYVTDIAYGVHQTESASAIKSMLGGFSSNSNSRTGSFTHRFTRTGTYYYWTDFLDTDDVLYFRGTITVTSLISSVGILSVKVHGNEASYNTDGSRVLDSSSCILAFSNLINCSDTTTLTTDPDRFNFEFRKCNSPYVDGISQTNGTTDDTITLTGDGFGFIDCQNEVTFDGSTCETVSSLQNSVGLKISVEDSPSINVPRKFELRVANLGYALTTIRDEREHNFVLLPWIENVTPSEGSKVGGTKLTISGSGFVGEVDNVFVDWQYLSCDIESVNYTHIICETHCGSTPDNCYLGSMPGHIFIGNTLAECLDSICNFTTVEEKTAAITGLSPDTVSAASTEITVIGDGFGTIGADLYVKIGGEDCVVSGTVTDTNFTCTVGRLPVGDNRVNVYVGNNGKAATTLTILSQKVANIDSPSESSTYGGAQLTLTGNGFVNGDTSVTVDGEDCPVISTTFEEITCTLPAHPEGNKTVIITSNGIEYDSLILLYSVSATPNVTDITPSEGQSGYEVTITGTGFKPSAINPTVTIGGIECSVTAATETSITCNVGTKQTGSYDVQVFAPGRGYSNANIMFTYTLGDFTINPTTGSSNGGQLITLDGSGFLEDATIVTICGEPCTEISVSASEYVCSTPKFIQISANEVCNVVVTVEGVTRGKLNAYTFDPSLVSNITSVNPSRGGTGGGTLVTITGTNFGSSSEDISVTIANVNCTVQSVDDTEITCRTGSARSADAFVSVQRSGWGEAVQFNAAFTYIDVWSSPYTWGGSSPPTDGEFVIIPVGQKILLDIDTGVLSMLLIQGEMIFDEENIELQADNILITDGGSLQIGSADSPFPRDKKAIITLHGHLRSRELPIYGTKVLAVREGTLNLYGAPVTYTWTRVNRTAAAGSSVLELMDSVDWQVGDEIVIATTGPRHSQKESEVHVISDISDDGYTLTLASPLAYEHIGISGTFGDVKVDFRAEVGLLSRNVLVRGYRNVEFDTVIEACPDGFNTGEFATQTCFQGRFGEELGSDEFGAQIMIHQAVKDTQIAQAHIQFVEFTHSGQAFRLGRYPIHFHLNGDMSQSFVRGCGIHTSFNRAVNVHGSHNVLVEHNVIYNIKGGAFFLEDGDEIGNIFQFNLAIFVHASTSLRNDDITPAAFWVTNPNNVIRHNAVAGGTHFGMWYRLHENPDGPGFDRSICPKATPLGEFRDNSAHSLGWFGLWIFESFVPRERASCSSSAPHKVAKFYSLTAWNCEKGAEGVNTGAVQFREFVLVNNEKAGYEGKLIVSSPPKLDPENSPGIFDSTIVAHYDSNLRGDATAGGVVIPYQSIFMIDNNAFYNFNRSRSSCFRWTRIDGHCGTYCGGFTSHTANLTFINSPRRVAFAWESEGVLYDRDGSLTGNAGYSVAACTPSFDNTKCTRNDLMSVIRPGCVCTDDIKLIRFSFNNIAPDSLNFKDAIFTTTFGSSFSPWARKRITHKKGWSMVLMANHYYDFTFENADHITNISFIGDFYNFYGYDFVVFTQFAEQKPDFFTLDGNTHLEMDGSQLTGRNVHYGKWFYSVPDRSLTYAISHPSREASPSPRDFPIRLEASRCFYRGCEPPKLPVAITSEPANAEKWSDASTWLNLTADGLEPKSMDDLTIPLFKWIIVDKALPPLGKLVIKGGLQFENVNETTVLEVDYIYITGRLVVGWSEEEPYLGKVIIRLRGSHSTPAYSVTDGPPLGSKFIAAFGGLQLHGVDRGITKTFLASTAFPGNSTIIVRDNVTWTVNDEILITTTDYDPWHTEVFKIIEVMDNTITLNDSIAYRHIAHSEDVNGEIIDLSASVALLTRSIRIEGMEYPEMEEESFGARVVVGQTFDSNGQHSGFAQVSNVEFYHTGQEGFADNYDARFSLTYFDVTTSADNIRYSYVKKSTFHSGYNTAVGVFGTDNLEIYGNVVYHTVGPGIRTESTGTKITDNLVSLSIWPGAYQDRFEDMNYDYDGAIHASKASDLSLMNNIIAGSERVGYHLPGQACSTAAEDLWTNNVAQTCLAGVLIFFSDPVADGRCVLFHGFKSWKNTDFGIYYLNTPSVEMKNNILVENGVSLFPYVIGPDATRHAYADKTVLIENNVLIGKTSSFSESEDKVQASDDNIRLSAQGRSDGAFLTCGKTGIMSGTFSSGPNMAPEKPFTNIMSYPAIKGRTIVNGNTFVNFGSCTGGYDHAFSTNKNNDDGIHPTLFDRTTLSNVNSKAKILYHRPNIGKINPSDCVDMDCDGHKKTLITDVDGAFLGFKGTVLPDSAYEWDGDPRRGLGDYRIPTVMLTTSTGGKIDVDSYAPHKGIFKTDNCTWIAEWNAFSCGDDYQWRMLVIESMDADTETRRLSPVAIYHPEGYVDLINGPQDHGWCAGYTCQERLSTFMSIVALDEPFDIFLSSTNPKVMRYMLLNSAADECVRLGMWYHATYRLEVSVDGVPKLPKNGFRTESGAFRLKMQETTNEFMPDVKDKINGEYYISQLEQMIFWVQCGGGSEVTVTMREVFIVALTLPPVTEAEFFGERIVENLAAFLTIDPKKVRIVNIVEDTSTSGRRKRQTDSVTFYVEIGDDPGESNTIEYETVVPEVINAIQLGTIDEVINATVLYTAIIEPNSTESGELVTLQRVGQLVLDTHPVGNSVENEVLQVQPKLKVTDDNGDVVTQLGAATTVWEIEASIKSGESPTAMLTGDTMVNFTGGWANFTSLAITEKGSYILEFRVVSPPQATNYSLETLEVTVTGRNIGPKATLKTTDRLVGSPVELDVSLVDKDTNTDITDIEWADHTWTATAAIFEPDSYSGTLNGTLTVTFDPSSGKATFNDLLFSEPGVCPILVIITSDRDDYEVRMVVYIDVMTSEQTNLVVAERHDLEVKLPIIFDPATAPIWTTKVRSHYSNYRNMRIVTASARNGSVIITLTIEATISGYNDTLHNLCSDIESGTTFTVNNQTVAMSGYLTVDGVSYYGESCGTVPTPEEEDDCDELDTVYIIVIAVLSGIILILICILIAYKCHIHHKSQGTGTQNTQNRGLYNRRDLLNDALSHDGTMTSLKSRPYTPSVPPMSTGKSFDLSMSSPSPTSHRRGKVSPEPINGNSTASVTSSPRTNSLWNV